MEASKSVRELKGSWEAEATKLQRKVERGSWKIEVTNMQRRVDDKLEMAQIRYETAKAK